AEYAAGSRRMDRGPAEAQARREYARAPACGRGSRRARRLPARPEMTESRMLRDGAGWDSPAAKALARTWSDKPGLIGRLSTVDHKVIGLRFIVTALGF